MGIVRWGWYSIGVNVILAIINLVVATASGSLAVTAETVHNVVDLLAAVAVLIGLKLSSRKSKNFPYGLYKLENVIAVGLAVMIFVTAYEIARDALLAPVHEATVNAWMLAGIAVATAIPLLFSYYELRAGREANSPALIADAKEYRAHVFTTGVVFVALVAQWLDFPLDRVAALVIVVAVVKTGWDLLSDGMRVLLDASLDADTLLQIREIMLAEPQVSALKWVTGRNAGRYRFVEGEVTLRISDLGRAEGVLQKIEGRIREAVPHVDRVLIHAEPAARAQLRYAVPLDAVTGPISPHFGEAPFFALVTVSLVERAVTAQEILSNPFIDAEKAKGIRVAEWLVGHKADVVLIKEELKGKGPTYVFGDAGVEVRSTDASTLLEVTTWAKDQAS